MDQIHELTLRLTRKFDDRPLSIYYISLDELPRTQSVLDEYQDKLIGKYYFDGAKNLQWSNYLLFIKSKTQLTIKENNEAKKLIENDRNYARKFVISDDELAAILNPSKITPTTISRNDHILSNWTEKLREYGLDEIVFGDDNLPEKIKLIEDTPFKYFKTTKSHHKLNKPQIMPFISSNTT